MSMLVAVEGVVHDLETWTEGPDGVWLSRDPRFADLRRDPRFGALLQRIGR